MSTSTQTKAAETIESARERAHDVARSLALLENDMEVGRHAELTARVTRLQGRVSQRVEAGEKQVALLTEVSEGLAAVERELTPERGVVTAELELAGRIIERFGVGVAVPAFEALPAEIIAGMSPEALAAAKKDYAALLLMREEGLRMAGEVRGGGESRPRVPPVRAIMTGAVVATAAPVVDAAGKLGNSAANAVSAGAAEMGEKVQGAITDIGKTEVVQWMKENPGTAAVVAVGIGLGLWSLYDTLFGKKEAGKEEGGLMTAVKVVGAGLGIALLARQLPGVREMMGGMLGDATRFLADSVWGAEKPVLPIHTKAISLLQLPANPQELAQMGAFPLSDVVSGRSVWSEVIQGVTSMAAHTVGGERTQMEQSARMKMQLVRASLMKGYKGYLQRFVALHPEATLDDALRALIDMNDAERTAAQKITPEKERVGDSIAGAASTAVDAGRETVGAALTGAIRAIDYSAVHGYFKQIGVEVPSEIAPYLDSQRLIAFLQGAGILQEVADGSQKLGLTGTPLFVYILWKGLGARGMMLGAAGATVVALMANLSEEKGLFTSEIGIMARKARAQLEETCVRLDAAFPGTGSIIRASIGTSEEMITWVARHIGQLAREYPTLFVGGTALAYLFKGVLYKTLKGAVTSLGSFALNHPFIATMGTAGTFAYRRDIIEFITTQTAEIAACTAEETASLRNCLMQTFASDKRFVQKQEEILKEGVNDPIEAAKILMQTWESGGEITLTDKGELVLRAVGSVTPVRIAQNLAAGAWKELMEGENDIAEYLYLSGEAVILTRATYGGVQAYMHIAREVGNAPAQKIAALLKSVVPLTPEWRFVLRSVLDVPILMPMHSSVVYDAEFAMEKAQKILVGHGTDAYKMAEIDELFKKEVERLDKHFDSLSGTVRSQKATRHLESLKKDYDLIRAVARGGASVGWDTRVRHLLDTNLKNTITGYRGALNFAQSSVDTFGKILKDSVNRPASSMARASRLLPRAGRLIARGLPYGVVMAAVYELAVADEKTLSALKLAVTGGSAAAVGVAGGILGRIAAGAALGAAGGSVAPIAGNVVGGIVGGLLGAFGGEALGEAGTEYMEATMPNWRSWAGLEDVQQGWEFVERTMADVGIDIVSKGVSTEAVQESALAYLTVATKKEGADGIRVERFMHGINSLTREVTSKLVALEREEQELPVRIEKLRLRFDTDMREHLVSFFPDMADTIRTKPMQEVVQHLDIVASAGGIQIRMRDLAREMAQEVAKHEQALREIPTKRQALEMVRKPEWLESMRIEVGMRGEALLDAETGFLAGFVRRGEELARTGKLGVTPERVHESIRALVGRARGGMTRIAETDAETALYRALSKEEVRTPDGNMTFIQYLGLNREQARQMAALDALVQRNGKPGSRKVMPEEIAQPEHNNKQEKMREAA